MLLTDSSFAEILLAQARAAQRTFRVVHVRNFEPVWLPASHAVERAFDAGGGWWRVDNERVSSFLHPAQLPGLYVEFIMKSHL